jgi:hypothetical protein
MLKHLQYTPSPPQARRRLDLDAVDDRQHRSIAAKSEQRNVRKRKLQPSDDVDDDGNYYRYFASIFGR